MHQPPTEVSFALDVLSKTWVHWLVTVNSWNNKIPVYFNSTSTRFKHDITHTQSTKAISALASGLTKVLQRNVGPIDCWNGTLQDRCPSRCPRQTAVSEHWRQQEKQHRNDQREERVYRDEIMTWLTDVFNECSLGHAKICLRPPRLGAVFQGQMCGHRVMLVNFGRGEHQL